MNQRIKVLTMFVCLLLFGTMFTKDIFHKGCPSTSSEVECLTHYIGLQYCEEAWFDWFLPKKC